MRTKRKNMRTALWVPGVATVAAAAVTAGLVVALACPRGAAVPTPCHPVPTGAGRAPDPSGAPPPVAPRPRDPVHRRLYGGSAPVWHEVGVVHGHGTAHVLLASYEGREWRYAALVDGHILGVARDLDRPLDDGSTLDVAGRPMVVQYDPHKPGPPRLPFA